MDKLPIEILAKIFSYIPNDLLKFKHLSKKWNVIFETNKNLFTWTILNDLGFNLQIMESFIIYVKFLQYGLFTDININSNLEKIIDSAMEKLDSKIIELLLANKSINLYYYYIDKIYWLAAKYGDIKTVGLLLSDSRFNPTHKDNSYIIDASIDGNTEIVRILLTEPRIDPNLGDGFILERASTYGHTDVVKLLLDDPRINPAAIYNSPIMYSSCNGHTGVVELLLKNSRINPAVHNNEPIINASSNGHIEIVRLLLADPRVDPTDQHNRAISNASNIEIIKLLLNDSRVKQKLIDDGMTYWYREYM